MNWTEYKQVVTNRLEDKTNRLLAEEWKLGGQVHREHGPAIIHYDSKGKPVYEAWFASGEPHRGGGLRCTFNRSARTGVIFHENWQENGRYHRLRDKPAVIERDPRTGHLTTEEWYVAGLRHRAGGKPAVVTYDPKTGKLIEEEWYLRGKSQRKRHVP